MVNIGFLLSFINLHLVIIINKKKHKTEAILSSLPLLYRCTIFNLMDARNHLNVNSIQINFYDKLSTEIQFEINCFIEKEKGK